MSEQTPEVQAAPEWFAEPPSNGYRQQYALRARLDRARTEFQDLEIIETEPFGRALLLDGALQTSVSEEFLYHEPLAHVPLFAHPNPRRILVIGGGDGGTLRHALLHPTVERAVEVEIDRGVVDFSLRYLPEISQGAYDDPRAHLIIDDGARFMAETDERFDVILVDSTDPVGPAAALIGEPFIRAMRGVLASGGIVAMQSGSPLTQPREFHATVSAIRRQFPVSKPYLSWVLIYPGVVWSWTAASVDRDPAAIDPAVVRERLNALPEPLRWYNPAIHQAAFALPNFVDRLAHHDHPPTPADLRAFGHPLPGGGSAR